MHVSMCCSELEDLERSHAYLTDLVERMSIPVFSDINVALLCTKTVVQNVRLSDNIELCLWSLHLKLLILVVVLVSKFLVNGDTL